MGRPPDSRHSVMICEQVWFSTQILPEDCDPLRDDPPDPPEPPERPDPPLPADPLRADPLLPPDPWAEPPLPPPPDPLLPWLPPGCDAELEGSSHFMISMRTVPPQVSRPAVEQPPADGSTLPVKTSAWLPIGRSPLL